MKIAILANRARSFVYPLAEGLKRMLDQLEIETRIFYEGLPAIRRYSPSHDNSKMSGKYLIKYYRDFQFSRLLQQLQGFDVVIVVGHAPAAFMKNFLRDESLRSALPDIPIVLYDLVYLLTRGAWAKYLREGSVEHGIIEGGHYGLERYDHYLCASVVSEYPMPPGPQPYSLIGIHLDDKTLFGEEKKDFIALLDFERSDHAEERQIQIQALRETNTKYIELKGSYSLKEIRRIYRRCSIYFVAHRESFGLPICELQACGSYIFTPYSSWCPSHWLKEDLSVAGPGRLPSNFVVYDNDKQKLIDEIIAKKTSFNSEEVRESFQSHHSQLINGDLNELKKFIHKLQIGEIRGNSHQQYLN